MDAQTPGAGGSEPSEGTNSRFMVLGVWVVIKSELTGTNTSSGGSKPSEGTNSRFMVLGCHKIRIDWYKHQQRGFKAL